MFVNDNLGDIVGVAASAVQGVDFDPLLRIEDVSELTGIPVNTLRFYRQKGTGPRSARLGRRVVYRESEVHSWLAEQLDEVS